MKILGFNIWPFSHVAALTQFDPKTAKPINYSPPILPEGVQDFIQSSMKCVIVSIMVYLTNSLYPVAQEMEEAKMSIDKAYAGEADLSSFMWVWKITARDLFASLILPLGWHWILYGSNYAENIRTMKFNKDYPAEKHLWREVPYCVCTVLMGTVMEVWAMYMYSIGYFSNHYLEYKEDPLCLFLWIFFIPTWRDGHFYWVHRFMHKWNTTWIPDVGEWMYNNAHYLHH